MARGAVYLDHAATTPVRPEALEALVSELSLVGNPSSQHTAGRRARRVVEESREAIASALRVRAGDVVFTSGGTEADNLAVLGIYRSRTAEDPRRTRVLASAVEHHAVLDPVDWLGAHEGADISWLPVDDLGRIDLAWLTTELEDHADEIALVAVMWANNEVGTVQPVAEVAALCSDRGIPFHSDAVQAVGSLEVDGSVVDSLALSGHKFGAPVGVGALVLRRGLTPVPLVHGGGQEREIRSGTVDAAGIASLAAALTASMADFDIRTRRVGRLRDELVAQVQCAVSDVTRNGDPTSSLPGIAHLSFAGCEGDSLLLLLDAAGVECSRGSACSAGVPQPSHVMLAMGVDPVSARGSLRFSLGWSSTEDDVARLVEALPAVVARARRAGVGR